MNPQINCKVRNVDYSVRYGRETRHQYTLVEEKSSAVLYQHYPLKCEGSVKSIDVKLSTHRPHMHNRWTESQQKTNGITSLLNPTAKEDT